MPPSDVGPVVVALVVLGFMLVTVPRPRWSRRYAFAGSNFLWLARRWFVQDLKQAKREVLIITAVGRDHYYDRRSVKNALRAAATRGVKITIALGPDFNKLESSKALKTLATEGVITLLYLSEPPRLALRLVDDLGTYTTLPFPQKMESWWPPVRRPYLYTWRDPEIARRQRGLIEETIKHASLRPSACASVPLHAV